MTTLFLQKIRRLETSLPRNRSFGFELPEGLKIFMTQGFQPATRADWKVGVTTLAAPLHQARSSCFTWRLWAATVALVIPLTAAYAQPTVEWATVGGSAQTDQVSDMALTPAGEIYVAGMYDYDGDWGLSTTVFYKYDSSGGQAGSQAGRGELISGVAVDSKGNYYLSGRVWRPEELGMGLRKHFYLAKYSSTGTLLWERTAGPPTYSLSYGQIGYKMALDAAGSIYVAGKSSGPAVFGNITFPATPGGPLLCKYDANGTLLWAKRAEGQSLVYDGHELGGGEATNIALDPAGNIIISGTMRNGEADFGGIVVTIAGDSLGFTAKYNPAGEVLWVKTPGGGVGAVDRQGNIYSGFSKYDPMGELIWERTIPGASISSVTLDGKDEPVYAGWFTGKVLLDEQVIQSDSDTTRGILICKADASGKFQWAIGGRGDASSRSGSIVCDRAGTLYVAGSVDCVWSDGVRICDGTSMLGSFPLSVQIGGFNDTFVARLTDPTAVAVALTIARTASGLYLSWPSSFKDFVLESADTFPTSVWTSVPTAPAVEGNQNVVRIGIESGARFFRLRMQ